MLFLNYLINLTYLLNGFGYHRLRTTDLVLHATSYCCCNIYVCFMSKATDADSGEFGEILFALQPDNSG